MIPQALKGNNKIRRAENKIPVYCRSYVVLEVVMFSEYEIEMNLW